MNVSSLSDTVYVSGDFDHIRSPQVRFLQEAARLGKVHVFLWSDDIVRRRTGTDPVYPLAERCYFLESLVYVDQVSVVESLEGIESFPGTEMLPSHGHVIISSQTDSAGLRTFCENNALLCTLISPDQLTGFPLPSETASIPGRKKVLVTGCYDWLHSGHIRFFEEVSQLGDLYVVVGNDINVRFLKGEGHPLFSQDERRYMVQSVRYVKQALITSGLGWMDAEPEIAQVQPDIYAVNEDGDRPEKRQFCQEHGLEYIVLKRMPKDGLPRRESTRLRGF